MSGLLEIRDARGGRGYLAPYWPTISSFSRVDDLPPPGGRRPAARGWPRAAQDADTHRNHRAGTRIRERGHLCAPRRSSPARLKGAGTPVLAICRSLAVDQGWHSLGVLLSRSAARWLLQSRPGAAAARHRHPVGPLRRALRIRRPERTADAGSSPQRGREGQRRPQARHTNIVSQSGAFPGRWCPHRAGCAGRTGHRAPPLAGLHVDVDFGSGGVLGRVDERLRSSPRRSGGEPHQEMSLPTPTPAGGDQERPMDRLVLLVPVGVEASLPPRRAVSLLGHWSIRHQGKCPPSSIWLRPQRRLPRPIERRGNLAQPRRHQRRGQRLRRYRPPCRTRWSPPRRRRSDGSGRTSLRADRLRPRSWPALGPQRSDH